MKRLHTLDGSCLQDLAKLCTEVGRKLLHMLDGPATVRMGSNSLCGFVKRFVQRIDVWNQQGARVWM